MASNALSTPPSVSFLISCTGSIAEALMVCVAPNFFGGFELVVYDVHGDDGISVETAEKLNGVETDTATADDQS